MSFVRILSLAAAVVFVGCSSGAPSVGSGPSPYPLTLAPNQSGSCPDDLPKNGDACSHSATCKYEFPPSWTASGGCTATCETGDGGTMAWNVPVCE